MAVQLWYAMTPIQRLDVMNKVGWRKGTAAMFRRCIAYLAAHLDEYRH